MTTAIPEQAISRLEQLYAALDPERDLWLDAPWLRFAAQAATLAPGRPAEIAARIRGTAATLADHAGWLDPLASPLRYIVAATLVATDDHAEAFIPELERAHVVFRATGIRRGGWHELVAILALRVLRHGAPTSDTDVGMMRSIYGRKRLDHWFLTGRDDLPACALLATLDQPADVIARTSEATFGLMRSIGLPANDHVQLAADLLQLGSRDPAHAVARMRDLIEAFAGGVSGISGAEIEALALASCAAGEPQEIAQAIAATRDRLARLAPVLYGAVDTTLAADLVAMAHVPPAARLQARRIQAATLCLARVPMFAPPLVVDLPGMAGPLGPSPYVPA